MNRLNKSFKFSTYIKNGTIIIPKKHRHKITGYVEVNIRLLEKLTAARIKKRKEGVKKMFAMLEIDTKDFVKPFRDNIYK